MEPNRVVSALHVPNDFSRTFANGSPDSAFATSPSPLDCILEYYVTDRYDGGESRIK
jgi:hypothetical protein